VAVDSIKFVTDWLCWVVHCDCCTSWTGTV